MDSLSISSDQTRENNVNKKFLLSKKPVRQPNPIIYRKLRRGSRISEKQIEYPTDKELLRTIAYLRNATAVYYEPDKILPYNKGYIIDDEDEEEWISQSDEDHNSIEKGQPYQFDLSIQKSVNNPTSILTKNRKKKSSNFDKANNAYGISASSSHVVNIKDTHTSLEHGQELTKKEIHRSASTSEGFIKFCSKEIICPQEHRAALAVKLYGVQAAMLSALGNPFANISQSISPRNSSQILPLSLWQASTGLLPATIWTGMFIVSFVYTVMVVWSLAFGVPIISMLCLALLYSLSVLVAAASGFNVMCGTFSMSGILFASLGVLGFVLLLLVLVMLVLFASWQCTKQDGRTE
ncbi:hypothetical protein RJT34_18168 [Clitoria ternatea]|uniref:Transmembrane protein n=1 Tax=Clitoria ternatea TaxID=43366 RepID=A0AAN9PFJ9_CLITE